MSNRPQQSDPIPVFPSGAATVIARPVREGRQLAPEVAVRHLNSEVLSMSPASARAFADALRDAANAAEQ